ARRLRAGRSPGPGIRDLHAGGLSIGGRPVGRLLVGGGEGGRSHHDSGGQGEEQGAHARVEPLRPFFGKGLPTLCLYGHSVTAMVEPAANGAMCRVWQIARSGGSPWTEGDRTTCIPTY